MIFVIQKVFSLYNQAIQLFSFPTFLKGHGFKEKTHKHPLTNELELWALNEAGTIFPTTLKQLGRGWGRGKWLDLHSSQEEKVHFETEE